MINETISHYLAHHESVLRQLLSEADIPAEKLKEAVLYSLFPGGKRLRPMLVYLAGEVLELEQASLDIMAVAIELIHAYSLIHDDLPAMDNDDFRRGKPSCHRAFDEATAILVGDGLQTLAVELLVNYLPRHLSHEQTVHVIQALMKACGLSGMVSGQSLDLTELSRASLNEPQLRAIHQLKTGQLILACVNMVIAAQNFPSETKNKALRDYAAHLGLVFQMQDDYLDHYAEYDILGKGRPSDAANQKFTFASLYNKDELADLISEHFEFAKNALFLLGEKANNLLALTTYLEGR